eukprot:scaffold28823_cov17-Tisochrysis_lutea.AAC.1
MALQCKGCVCFVVIIEFFLLHTSRAWSNKKCSSCCHSLGTLGAVQDALALYHALDVRLNVLACLKVSSGHMHAAVQGKLCAWGG